MRSSTGVGRSMVAMDNVMRPRHIGGSRAWASRTFSPQRRAHGTTMPTSDPSGQLCSAFQQCLFAAITDGEIPTCGLGLGPQTIAAIEAIAREHPEAPVT